MYFYMFGNQINVVYLKQIVIALQYNIIAIIINVIVIISLSSNRLSWSCDVWRWSIPDHFIVLFTGNMACTVEKVLSDARLLVNRLKDHDNCADNVISQTQSLLKRMEAMKQVRTLVYDSAYLLFWCRCGVELLHHPWQLAGMVCFEWYKSGKSFLWFRYFQTPDFIGCITMNVLVYFWHFYTGFLHKSMPYTSNHNEFMPKFIFRNVLQANADLCTFVFCYLLLENTQ